MADRNRHTGAEIVPKLSKCPDCGNAVSDEDEYKYCQTCHCDYHLGCVCACNLFVEGDTDVLSDEEELRRRELGMATTCALSGKKIPVGARLASAPNQQPGEEPVCLYGNLEINRDLMGVWLPLQASAFTL